MNASERAELLRERFKTLFPVAAIPRPRCERKREPRPTPQPLTRAFYGIGQHEPDRRKRWLLTPDATLPVAPRAKRRNGVSALTRIAAHFPAKLPRQ